MEFVGNPGTSANIPVPNLGMSPEMLSKNYPLEFLLQPIIPLLSPPVSDEPSFSINVPGFSHVYDAICKVLDGPTIHVVGATIAATGVAYCAWKLSAKWNDGVFHSKVVDPDTTEQLDDEVARIMAVVKPEENTVTSACSSLMCQSKGDLTSNTSFFLERMSQDSLCLCAEGCGQIRQLHSRIDQVMSRMDDMISGLKALEVPKKESACSVKSKEDDDTKGTAMLEIAMEDLKNAKKQMESNHQVQCASISYIFPTNIKDGEIAKKAEDIQEGIRKLEVASEKLEKALEYGHPKKPGSRPSLIHDTFFIESCKKEDGYDPSPRNLRFINTTLFDKTKVSSDTHRPFPLRNLKRNIHSRNINLKSFPIRDDHTSACCTGTQDGNVGVSCVKDDGYCEKNDVIKISLEETVPLEVKYGFVDIRDMKGGDSDSKNKEFSRDTNDVKDIYNLKRHETWPMSITTKQTNASPNQQSDAFSNSLSFKHSDNSDFQTLEQFKASLCTSKNRTKQSKDLEDSSPVSTTPRSQHLNKCKVHNSPRTKQHHGGRSSHMSFKKKLSPAKSSALKPLDRLPEEPEPDSLSESKDGKTFHAAKDLEEIKLDCNLFKESSGSSRKLPPNNLEEIKLDCNLFKEANTSTHYSIPDQATDINDTFSIESSLGLRKRKLFTFDEEDKDKDNDAPPIKLPCRGTSIVLKSPSKTQLSPSCAVLDCSNQVHSVTSEPVGDMELKNNEDQTQGSPTALNQTIRFLTSPFKRNTKNDFQVKYVVAKYPNPDPGKNVHSMKDENHSATNSTATTSNKN